MAQALRAAVTTYVQTTALHKPSISEVSPYLHGQTEPLFFQVRKGYAESESNIKRIHFKCVYAACYQQINF